MKAVIKPATDFNKYVSYRNAFKAIDVLVKYYRNNPNKVTDMNDSKREIIDAKKKLVSTIYNKLTGVGGAGVPIADCHNQRINNVFYDKFSDEENTIIRKHLETTVKDKYANHITKYQEHTLTALPTASLTDLVAGAEVTEHKIKEIEEDPKKRYTDEGRRETARYKSLALKFSQTIEARLENEPIKKIAAAHRIFKNNILGQYHNYWEREEELKTYLKTETQKKAKKASVS